MRNELEQLADSADIEADIGRMEPLSPDAFEPRDEGDVLVLGPTGHGLMSWRFRLRARTPSLDLDFTLPCLRALEDEEARQRQANDLATVCKLACAAWRMAADGGLGQRRLVAACTEEDGCTWRIVGADGADERQGADWAGFADTLVGLLDGSPRDAMRIEA